MLADMHTEGSVLVRRSHETQQNELRSTKAALGTAEGQLADVRKQLQDVTAEVCSLSTVRHCLCSCWQSEGTLDPNGRKAI